MTLKVRTVKEKQVPKREFIPFLFGRELDGEDIDKVELFEKGLANEIKKSDTIEQAVVKVVKMAIASEFGVGMVKARGADAMVETIVTGILTDSELRKQALLIIDNYAKD